jgi:flagellin
LKVNVTNAEQANNLLQVAEGSLNETNGILIRLQELATQSSNSTVTDENRESIQAEFSHLIGEIDRIADATTYNNINVLRGFGNSVDADNSTALSDAADTGVTKVHISGAQTGTYTFVDGDNAAETEDADGVGQGDGDPNPHSLTLSNGKVEQTVSIGTMMDTDGSAVAEGTQVIVNFDRLGIQVTLAGAGVASAAGDYEKEELDGKTIVVDSGTGGSFQVGPKNDDHNRIDVSIADMSATGPTLNLTGENASVASLSSARTATTAIDKAILAVSQQRGNLGAVQNRLGFAISWTENEIENIQASEASISDADIAEEVAAFTKARILSQAATAMLAQANVMPQNALALLMG